MKLLTAAAVAATTLIVPTFASAHATLETQEAPADATYKGVMRIGHGCDGEATLSVTIQIPEGVINAKPMPKPGWDMTTVVEAYEKTYDYYGPRSEGVTSITWTGSLEDAHYDEFVFRARVTDSFEPGDVIYFPTVQKCATGENAWVEIPAAGQDRHDLDGPAPGLTIKAKAHHGH